MELVEGARPRDDDPLPSCRGVPGIVKERMAALGRDGGHISYPNAPPSPAKWQRSPPEKLPGVPVLSPPSPAETKAKSKVQISDPKFHIQTPAPGGARRPSMLGRRQQTVALPDMSRCTKDEHQLPQVTVPPPLATERPSPTKAQRRAEAMLAPEAGDSPAKANGSPAKAKLEAPEGLAKLEGSPAKLERRNSAPHALAGRWNTVRSLVRSDSDASISPGGYTELADEEEGPDPPVRQKSKLSRLGSKVGLGSSFAFRDKDSSKGGGLLGQLSDLADEAMRSKVHLDHETRQATRDDAETEQRWFLSDKLMMREIHRRRGSDAWQSKLVKVLHANWLQQLLIVLLLLDVLIVFTELFLEGTYPACEIITRDATSCCPADGHMPLDAHHHRHLFDGADEVSPSLAAITGAHGHQRVRMLADLVFDIGDGHGSEGDGHGHGHGPVCGGGLVPRLSQEVYCDPHKHARVHHLETGFSLITVLILIVFEVELVGLLLALDRLFFRSLMHVFDLVVITSSLWLQLYIYYVRLRGDSNEDAEMHDPHGEAILPDDIQALILFSRCWRFVRVGHGIATGINDMVRAKQHEIQKTVEELKEALRQIESENYAAARQTSAPAHTSPAGERPPANGTARPTGLHRGSNRGSMKTVYGRSAKSVSGKSGLHNAHDALDKLAQQAAY